MKEFDFTEDKKLREDYIKRIDVLDRVNELLLLPDVQLATRQQVADYYEVSESAIRMIEVRYIDEVEFDGFKVWKAEDFKTHKTCELKINKNRGSFDVEFSNGNKERFSPRGVALYTRRSILRIGMLLRDSEIAKEVRTQLLNIEEKVVYDDKTLAIDDEKSIVLNIVYGKDEIERANATRALLNYKNRYINKLEEKVDVLATGNLTWNQRESVNRMVRKIAAKKFKNSFVKAWDKIYAEMLYKHNINISTRIINKQNNLKTKSKLTIFDVVNKEEMNDLVKSCFSLCETYNVKTDDLMVSGIK